MNQGIDSYGLALALGILLSGSACSESGSDNAASQGGSETDSGTTSATNTTASHGSAVSSSTSSSSSTGAGAAGTATSTLSTSVGGAGPAGSGGSAGDGGATSTSGGAGGSGSQAAGGSDSAGGTGGVSGTGGSGACSADYAICEDFENTELGDVPEAWTQHGDAIGVADDEAHSGERSLRMDAIPVWERRIYHDAAVLGGAHWGRIFYKVELPVPEAFVHSTIVALSGDGPRYGASEFRVVDTVKQAVDTPDVGSLHQFLYNVQPENSGEFAREGPYDQAFDDEWHCAEYRIDASNQSYALYIDGDEELSFEDGAGEYDRSDIPEVFAELRIGWINYQEAPPGFTAWIDDIAFGSDRIGCGD